MDYTYRDIAKMIDHALLQPAMTSEQLDAGCQLAMAYDVASVCVMPYYLKRTAELLADSTVRPSTTIGFPHGGQSALVKQAEARQAIADGGQELDMVVNISQVRSGAWRAVRDDIAGVVTVTHQAERQVKVIFENCYLQDDEKIRLCEICGELQVDWVKTSTGFGTGGATLEDVTLMRTHSPAQVQVKAAGGVRDLETLLAMRKVGATRIGTSGTASLLDACRAELGLGPIGLSASESASDAY